MDIAESLLCNPNGILDTYEWTHNCQRCVWAYELRRRGYNVVAGPKKRGDNLGTPYHLARCIKGGKWIPVKSQKDITDIAGKAGDSRWMIFTHQKGKSASHVWILEIKGRLFLWLDPQLQNYVNPYERIKNARKNMKIMRIDQGELNWSYLKRFVEEVEDQ